MKLNYDVIVVGGGHAGCEAAAAAAKMGSKTLLITMNMMQFAQMSCNPSIGGIAKGQLIREIDAIGGLTGIVTDKSAIQFRMLNKSKGPAMWSPRTQNDRYLFSYYWRMELEKLENLDFWQDIVTGFFISNDKCTGVKTEMNYEFYANSIVLTTGTFLNGEIFIGDFKTYGGRISEKSSYGIAEYFNSVGIKNDRFKTGTSARIDGRTINFKELIEQPGDEIPEKFSFSTETEPLKKQRSCWLTRTNNEVHDILKTGFSKSPLFRGIIGGSGPRYCPSIEDKLERFSDKDSHHLFLEPEGWETNEYYINGFSSSLPHEVQFEALRKIKGLERVKMFRPGYAIGYDYFPPQQLNHSLESKIIENLFFAGQINGTTGYEEASAQGLIAGINANLKANNKKPFIPSRSESYIGVLLDDLVTKGVDEPYRLFTSRAEYRILLRQDSADLRLTEYGYNLGLIDDYRYKIFLSKKEGIEKLNAYIKKESIIPTQINDYLISINSSPINQSVKIESLVVRPDVSLSNILNNIEYKIDSFNERINNEIIEEVEILSKYSGYIIKENDLVEKLKKFEQIILRDDIDYYDIKSLSIESRQKLSKIRPKTLGQASRISGVSPSDITVLLTYFGK